MDGWVLQAFLLANVFAMGVAAAIAVRHARAHFRPKEPEKTLRPVASTAQLHLSATARERLVKEAETRFLEALNDSVLELQKDLRQTSANLNKQLQQLGSEVAISERGRYHDMLEELRKQTQEALKAAQAEITHHQEELKASLAEEQAKLKAKLAEEVAAEQQRIIRRIDTKLADAVTAFLTETLQHNVDLGAQTAYLTAMLEEHKADFKKEVADETPTTS